MQARAGMAVKGAMQVQKWREGQDPETDPPDEIVTVEQWVENGEVVTDPERIAELEALAAQDGDNS